MQCNEIGHKHLHFHGAEVTTCLALTQPDLTSELKTKLRGIGPRANYTDRATAACWQS
jgi:hypothetical protein